VSIFRENIQEIVDNWNGYPLQDSCNEKSPALNAGTIGLKCFINNVCPFYASGYKEDALVFNESTYKRIRPWLPDDLQNALTVTPGAEGMHFSPRMVFRNNYIYQKVDNDATAFEDRYKNISQIPPGDSNVTPGADETRYKAEQSWIVTRSIFDEECDTTGVPECDAQAEWAYISQKVSDTALDARDISYDYNLDYYQSYIDSIDPETGLPLPNQLLYIDPTRAQMPYQKNVLTTNNAGVHWRLVKRTPLYKGEDFFIRFYKEADTTVSNPNASKNIAPFPDYASGYWPLDITRSDRLDMDSRFGGVDSLQRKRNFAISPPTSGNDKPDSKKFDFHDQAYYIIELGKGTHEDRYFIIIAERANPIFVNFVPAVSDTLGSNDVVSKKFSEFESISGRQLIHSKSFDMTVRNHLGSIIIQFSGEGINVPPWIIKRLDWVPDEDAVTKEPYLKDKSRTMFVPRGKMVLMGGNIRSGFLFGPLQYQARYVSIIYPPREQTGKDEDDMRLAFNFGGPEEIEADSMAGAFKSNPFFLPSQGEHDLMFSATDIFLDDLYKHTVPVGEAAFNQPLFTQDSQYYRNYYESNDLTNPGPGQYRYGGHFYDDTIRDFSEEVTLPTAPAGIPFLPITPRTSNLLVKKYRFINDPKTKQQAFDVLIGMTCGDHVFNEDGWTTVSPGSPGNGYDGLGHASHQAIDDADWYLPSCKTPIMTSLRLISHESKSSRWQDGTTVMGVDGFPVLGGINKSPEEGTSSYFIDASDHVMSFSDSWSASGFSEMEHSGSINFYLNRELIFKDEDGNDLPEANVTDALIGLQNKTFYIEIWAGYTQLCPGDDGFPSYSRQEDMFKLFTGLCHGGSIDYQYGKNIMSCKVVDYTAVLKGTRFFNSPWFDGVRDINCIREIMQMSGFRDAGKYDPGNLIKGLADSSDAGSSQVFFHHFDGRLYKMETYALPSAYNRLDQPAFKFNDADPFMDAIVKIAKRAGKVFFFDQFGIAHYENAQDFIRSDYLGEIPLAPLCYFTTNPEIWPGQMVFNKLERNYDVQGVANHIKIMSNTPDFHLLIGDDLNWSSMENPDSEGFIGFLKSIYQQESMFGSKKAVLDTIRKYSVSFRPKIKSKFETYGVPLRANDIVNINGENTRVIKVTNTIVAEKNEWWMVVETEKYQPVDAPVSVF
jgi:hypothetical protein